jgi:hypothetical protein
MKLICSVATSVPTNSFGGDGDRNYRNSTGPNLKITYLKDLISGTAQLRRFRKSYLDPEDWTATLQAAADSGERTIRVHGDAPVTFAGQWSIESDGQKWVGDGEDNSSLLKRTTVADEAAIIVTGERNGMRNIGVQCDDFSGTTKKNIGLFVVRPDGRRADQDFTFRDGYISGFYLLAKNRGRGFTFIDSILSRARYGIDFDWPNDDDYVQGEGDVAKKDTGFRRLLVDGCEFHAMGVAGVRNRGANAVHAKLIIRDCSSNIGDGIFVGHLGTGSVIENCTVTNANTVAFQIDGGSDYTLTNNRVSGTRALSRHIEPKSFMTLTGANSGFVVDGFQGTYCRQNGIDMSEGDFLGTIRDIDLREIGSDDPSSHSGISVTGTGSRTDLTAIGISVRSSVAVRSVVSMRTPNSLLRYAHILPLGAPTLPVTGEGKLIAL